MFIVVLFPVAKSLKQPINRKKGKLYSHDGLLLSNKTIQATNAYHNYR